MLSRGQDARAEDQGGRHPDSRRARSSWSSPWAAAATARPRAAPPRRARPTASTASSPRSRAAGRPEMLRVGVDVGGTFTDLVGVDDAGRVSLAKSASTPADPSIGVMDGLALLAAELGTDLGRAAGRDRADRARHHGGHQRPARAQGREGRHADHRGPPRRDRDARGPQGRPLQPAHGAARAPGAARATARRDRADALRRQRGDAALEDLGRRRRSAGWAPRASARSRSATCTPTAIRATSGRPGSCSRGSCPTPTCRSPRTCSRRSRSTSASAPPW